MAIRVEVTDSVLSGNVVNRLELHLPSERTSARAIIEARIRQEVEAYNRHQEAGFRGLVTPTEMESGLNGAVTSNRIRKRPVDAEAQCLKAVEAFMANGFFLLVDDRQVTELDDALQVNPLTTIRFVRLVPLVGG